MKSKQFYQLAKKIASLCSTEAGKELKRLYDVEGADFVDNLLNVLQDYNDSAWWYDMMVDAGEDVKKLY